MGAGRCQLDVAHALAAHLAHRHFNAALVADDAAVLHALVLAAEAIPVGHWSKDARAEQTVAFRLERAVVNGLRLGYLTMRPATDLLRRCKHDADGVKVGNGAGKLKRVRTEQGDPPWRAFRPAAAFPGISERSFLPGKRCLPLSRRTPKILPNLNASGPELVLDSWPA